MTKRRRCLKARSSFALILGLLALSATYHLVSESPSSFTPSALTTNDESTNGTSCIPSPSQPIQSFDFASIPIRNSTTLLPQPQLQQADCEFVHNKLFRHFPHAMQQLYFCWSFWQTTNQPPVLIENPSLWERFEAWKSQPNDSFIPGMRKAMQTVFGMQSQRHSTKPNVVNVVPLIESEKQYVVYAIDHPHHMEMLRDGIVQHYFGLQQLQSCLAKPRIAILNRLNSRSLLNIPEIQGMLKQLLDLEKDVTVMHFEDKPFLNQVEFFASYDIIISGHGAQLTGLPFLPTCGGIFEFFPRDYLEPSFFGSLAKLSGKHHAYAYLSDTPQSHRGATAEARQKLRDANLCPPVDRVRQGVERLVEEWKVCCADRNDGE